MKNKNLRVNPCFWIDHILYTGEEGSQAHLQRRSNDAMQFRLCKAKDHPDQNWQNLQVFFQGLDGEWQEVRETNLVPVYVFMYLPFGW